MNDTLPADRRCQNCGGVYYFAGGWDPTGYLCKYCKGCRPTVMANKIFLEEPTGVGRYNRKVPKWAQ